jgi:hypothetical protein
MTRQHEFNQNWRNANTFNARKLVNANLRRTHH